MYGSEATEKPISPSVENYSSESFVGHLQFIASRLPIGVLIKDVGREFTYRFWNVGMERLYGLSSEQVIGRDDYQLFSEAEATASRAEDLEVLRRDGKPLFGRPLSSERSDRERTVQHAKFLVREGENDYLVSLVNDVTGLWESKRALKAANEWKGLMLSVVSHDVLAPLQALVQGLEQMNGGTESMDPETRERTLSYLQAGAQRTTDLLEDILTWSTSGDTPTLLEKEWMDLGSVVQSVARRVSLTTGRNIELHLPATLPVYTNEPAVRTVVRNLATNACKHGGGGAVRVVVDREGENAVVTFINGGPGISKHFLQSLNRGELPGELMPGVSGRRGIGLQLCLTLSKGLGASLQFGREKPTGTKVRFALPNPREPG